MQMGTDKSGMQTLNQCLANLVQRRMISIDTALQAAYDLDELKSMMQRLGMGSAK
jgi:twitching motility protein PilT